MKDSSGDISFPIWLVADSEPEKWQSRLDSPLDPRHPARHNIWTPVLDYMQDYLYRNGKRRFNTENLYIINAVKNSNEKPKGEDLDWSEKLQAKVSKLRTVLLEAKPKVVLSFGAFAFEFLRRASGDKNTPEPFSHWGTRELGRELKEHIDNYSKTRVNIIPLLHVSIARGKFLESHKYFVDEENGNYFEFVGHKLAKLFLRELAWEPIWIN